MSDVRDYTSILCTECSVRFYVDADTLKATCPVCGGKWKYDLKTERWELEPVGY